MYLVGLHGHGTSAWPGCSGAPTECTARTKNPLGPDRRSTGAPIRVMTRIEAATYGESVISTPSWEIGEPSGPMQNGTTYMVRPRIAPAKISANVARISSGAIQLLVGPASSSCSEQMKVRSSTRATSTGRSGPEAARPQLRVERRSVPCSTSRLVSWAHSSSDPSHHCTASGLVSSAISPTHAASSGRLVFAR